MWYVEYMWKQGHAIIVQAAFLVMLGCHVQVHQGPGGDLWEGRCP